MRNTLYLCRPNQNDTRMRYGGWLAPNLYANAFTFHDDNLSELIIYLGVTTSDASPPIPVFTRDNPLLVFGSGPYVTSRVKTAFAQRLLAKINVNLLAHGKSRLYPAVVYYWVVQRAVHYVVPGA